MLELIAHAEPEQRILVGDVREGLRSLPAGSVQCVVTSPPYWGLRCYGTDPQVWGGDSGCQHDWTAGRTIKRDRQHMQEFGVAFGTGGGNKHSAATVEISTGDTCCLCGAWRGELGSEPTPELFIAHMVEVFREVRRVLRSDGTLWLNIGDSYNAHPGQRKVAGPKQSSNPGSVGAPSRSVASLKPKDMCGIPWMLALALRADGWWLRDEIIWHKRNTMPSSVTDRTTRAHEQVFLLTKSARYFYDADAIREPVTSTGVASFGKQNHEANGNGAASRKLESPEQRNHPLGRNKRSVWDVPTQSYHGAHFATFPVRLVMPMILAGTSEKGCCSACGAPWRRVVDVSYENPGNRTTNGPRSIEQRHESPGFSQRLEKRTVTTGWEPGCTCSAEVVP